MARFAYIVRDDTGRKVFGSEDSVNIDELTKRLQAKNLIIINIVPEAEKKSAGMDTQGGWISAKHKMHGSIKQEDMVLFCRQLSTLLGAGVTISKALNIISKQVNSRMLLDVVQKMIKDLEAGLSLRDAMARHPKVFSDLWVNLAESGEASGNLPIILTRLVGYLERDAEFKKKLISALIYPSILLVAGLGALLFMSIKIIPTFAEIFKSSKVELPPLTQAILAVSNFLRKNLLLILGTIIGGIFLFKKYLKTGSGKRAFERFLFRLPVLGEFFRGVVLERFSSGMSTLTESGIPILYSLEISERSVDNLLLADLMRVIKEDVRQGKPLKEALEKSGFFDVMFIQMIAVGEEIGELPQMFKRINTYYQEYVETFLVRVTTLFEPLMLLFMGGVIGIMVVGMFLPIFKLSSIGGG